VRFCYVHRTKIPLGSMTTSHPQGCRTCGGGRISPTGSGSGRTGSTSLLMRKCMTLTAALCIHEHQISTPCRYELAGASLRRWDGSGTSARRMAGIPARCLRSGFLGRDNDAGRPKNPQVSRTHGYRMARVWLWPERGVQVLEENTTGMG